MKTIIAHSKRFFDISEPAIDYFWRARNVIVVISG